MLEYYVINFGGMDSYQIEEQLNRKGKLGWKVVSYSHPTCIMSRSSTEKKSEYDEYGDEIW